MPDTRTARRLFGYNKAAYEKNAANIANSTKEKEASIDWFLFGKTGFFAGLNFLDFVTDILVLLQFGCLFGAPLQTDCSHSDSAPDLSDAQCTVHPWWLAISATILFCSSVGSAYMYSQKSRSGVSKRDVRMLAGGISFIVALLQLAPFMDLIHMYRHRGKFMDEDKKKHILMRDLVIKLVESAPQAFFQAYVLFALEAHRQPLRVFSLSVSVCSLSLSLALALPELTPAAEMLWTKYTDEEQHVQTEEQLTNQSSSSESEECDFEPESAHHDEGRRLLKEEAGLRASITQAAARMQARVTEKRKSRQSHYARRTLQQLDAPKAVAPRPQTIGSPQAEGGGYGPGAHKQAPLNILGSPLHESKIGKFFFWVYLAADTLIRSGAYSVVLSEPLRHLGIPLAITFALLQLVLSFWDLFVELLKGTWWVLKKMYKGIKLIPGVARDLFRGIWVLCGPRHLSDEGSDGPQDWDVGCAQLCEPCLPCLKTGAKIAYFATVGPVSLVIGVVVFGILLTLFLVTISPLVAVVVTFGTLAVGSFAIAMTSVPVVLTFHRDPKQKVAFASMRTGEYLCFGFMAVMLGQTPCGESLHWEIGAFFLLLGINLVALLIFVALHYCLKPIVRWERAWGDRLSRLVSALLCTGKTQQSKAQTEAESRSTCFSFCPRWGCCVGSKPTLLETE